MASVDTQQQIRELESLRRQRRIWQTAISLLLLLFVVSSILTLRNAAMALANEGATRDAFVKDLSTSLQTKTLPAIEQMGTQALHEINWQAEVQKLNKRTPELAQASLKEIKTLGNNLSTKGKKVFTANFDTALKQRESKIKTMFPEATPDQVTSLIATLTQEAQAQVGDVSGELFSPHKAALDGIVTDLTKIQAEEAPNIKNETPTLEMGLLVFDIVRADMKDLEPAGDAPASKKTAPKEVKK